MQFKDIPESFAGRNFTPEDLELIREVVESCTGISRTELAKTMCELLSWHRPNGSPRALECRKYLEQLETCGFLRLPVLRRRRPPGSKTKIPKTQRGAPQEPLTGTVKDLAPIEIQEARTPEQGELFRELIGRYHYEGYEVAYGAQLRYLIYGSRPQHQVLGCLRFSSPAWRMSARDQWIGWDEPTRVRNLQQVVCNSRFLLLPWVQVRNLASHVLSLAARRVVVDWPARYGTSALLLETLVDPERFSGTCYRAANWIEVGMTSGRGRMDREHQRHGLAPKKILVYPLVRGAARHLREG
jgi:hypothetical protein